MGIEALRRGLSEIFCDLIQAELPKLNEESRNHLSTKIVELQVLDKVTLQDNRKYLKSVVEEYKARMDQRFNDRLNDGAKGGVESLEVKLEACMKTLSDALSSRGATKDFQTATSGKDLSSDMAAISRCTGDPANERNIYTWINECYQTNNNYMIPGTIPETLIAKLFKEQTSQWETITTEFTTAVSSVLQDAVKGCLECIGDKDKLIAKKCEDLMMKALRANFGPISRVIPLFL
jgi:Dynamin central region